MPASRPYRFVGSFEYTTFTPAFTTLDPSDPTGTPITYTVAVVSFALLEQIRKKLHLKEIDVFSSIDADIADEIGAKAKQLFTNGLPAPVSDFVVNHSRPTSDPDIWKWTPGMAFWLHPITGTIGSTRTLACAQVETTPPLWACLDVMAYQL